MDNEYLLEQIGFIGSRGYDESGLVELFDIALLSDESKLAAALLLCAYDSNERKAGE